MAGVCDADGMQRAVVKLEGGAEAGCGGGCLGYFYGGHVDFQLRHGQSLH